jgi:DNA-binding protein HU-beta
MKEAADAFQYWRNAVGDDAAWSHVEAEFGDVLKRIGITAKNVNDLRGNIVGLTPKIEKIKDKKVKDETFKEQSKELAQLNRKDFEKFRDEYSSKVQNELDNLTRAWEIFNNVRNATGNIELAVQISGADYANGQTRNLADALRQKIEKDLSASGAALSLDMTLSDKDIEEQVKKAMPKEGETRIKGIVEEYKKWRDLQRDVLKGDIDVFNSIIGSAVDYESQLRKINSDYEKRKASLDAGLANGTIKQGDYNQAIGILDAETEAKRWQASQSYIDLMNNSLAMTKDEIEAAARTQEDSLNRQLKAGLITIKQYSDEMAKLRGITSNYRLETTGRYSNRFTAFMTGGGEGLQEYYRRRANKYWRTYNNSSNKNSAEAQEAKKQAEHYDDLAESPKKAAETVVTEVFDEIIDTLKDGGEISISGFGKFEVKERAAREGINPATKEKIQIAASKAVGFKASKTLKEAVK